MLKAELIMQPFSLPREGKKDLAAVKISKKSHLKTKDAEVTWAEGQSYVLPLYFFKSFFGYFFQILYSHTVIREQLFRCIRNGSAKRLLGVTWEPKQFGKDKHHQLNILFINTSYIPSIQSDKM